MTPEAKQGKVTDASGQAAAPESELAPGSSSTQAAELGSEPGVVAAGPPSGPVKEERGRNALPPLLPGATLEGTVHLKSGRDGPVRAGHPWVFSGAVREIEGAPFEGAFVRVLGAEGNVLGAGSYSAVGSLTVRMFTRAEVPIDAGFVRERLRDAHALRSSIGLTGGRAGFRLINAEGDGMPGVVVDVYGGFAVMQLLSAGAERLRAAVLDALCGDLGIRGVFERSTGGARRAEGLRDVTGLVAGEEPPAEIEIDENGMRLLVDVRGGQKTGFYLDQRGARALVRRLAQGRRVLNAFAYTGACAVAAGLGGAAQVVSVETSGPSLELARRSWALDDRLGSVPVSWLCGDAFEALDAERGRGRFDLIVLDPPPFARHRSDLERAMRAYRDLNRRALEALAPGGLLVTCSCSPHVSRESFVRAVAGAARAPLRSQVLAQLGFEPDHPVLPAHAEGEYLKGLLVRPAVG